MFVVYRVQGDRIAGGPAARAAVRRLADQAAVPDQVGRLLRRHQNGVVEVDGVEIGDDAPLERVERLHPSLRQVSDLVAVGVTEDAVEADHRQVGVEDDEAALDVARLQPPGDQPGALVGRRRAAVGHRRDSHDQITAPEALQLGLQRQVVAAGREGRGKVLPGMGGAVAVDPVPGRKILADAGRQDQPVVGIFAGGGYDFACAPVDATDFRIDEAVAVVLRRLPVVVPQPFALGEADQPAVGERLRPEFGLAVDQRDVDLRRQPTQMARRRQAAPAAADYDDTTGGSGRANRERQCVVAERGAEKGAASH